MSVSCKRLAAIAALLGTASCFGAPAYTPTAGEPCSKIAMTGVPMSTNERLSAFIADEPIVALRIGTAAIPGQLGNRPAIIATVPGDATSGLVHLEVRPYGRNLEPPKKPVIVTFPKVFTVKGSSISQPKILNFSAAQNPVDVDGPGTTLSWSIEGMRAGVPIIIEGLSFPLAPYQANGHVSADPKATTTYALETGNGCLSKERLLVVSVLGKVRLTVVPLQLAVDFGQLGAVVATITQRASDVDLWCSSYGLICTPPTITIHPNDARQIPFTLTPAKLGASFATIYAEQHPHDSTGTQHATVEVDTSPAAGKFESITISYPNSSTPVDVSQLPSTAGTCTVTMAAYGTSSTDSATYKCTSMDGDLPTFVVSNNASGLSGGIGAPTTVDGTTPYPGLFVVQMPRADPTDAHVTFQPLFLPTQTLPKVAPLTISNIPGNIPTYWYSPDGSLAALTNTQAANSHGCTQMWTLYDLVSGAQIACMAYNGSIPQASVTSNRLQVSVPFDIHDPCDKPQDGKPVLFDIQ